MNRFDAADLRPATSRPHAYHPRLAPAADAAGCRRAVEGAAAGAVPRDRDGAAAPSTELYETLMGRRQLLAGRPLSAIEPRAGLWLLPVSAATQHLYAVPIGDRYQWAAWELASRSGWSERYGEREYHGDELARRFLVLYYPAARRSWRRLGRLVEDRPLRIEVCGTVGHAEWMANRLMPRRQLGFHRELGSHGLVAYWGWDDREVGYHEECDADCGCGGPLPGREFVVVAEFESEAAAMVPDVRLEAEAWMDALTEDRALALTSCPAAGDCDPACPNCSVMYEELVAAREWRRRRVREVAALLRRRGRGPSEAVSMSERRS